MSLKTSATFQRTKITDFLLGYGKEKASTLEEERFHCQVEEIEVYESSSHEERKKPFQDNEKNGHFLYFSTATNHANDETEEKEEHLQTFFHPQNKTTENLNLRIKEATSGILKKNVYFKSPSLILWPQRRKNIFDVPSKKNWIIDY